MPTHTKEVPEQVLKRWVQSALLAFAASVQIHDSCLLCGGQSARVPLQRSAADAGRGGAVGVYAGEGSGAP